MRICSSSRKSSPSLPLVALPYAGSASLQPSLYRWLLLSWLPRRPMRRVAVPTASHVALLLSVVRAFAASSAAFAATSSSKRGGRRVALPYRAERMAQTRHRGRVQLPHPMLSRVPSLTFRSHATFHLLPIVIPNSA